jgi:VanZ family protein
LLRNWWPVAVWLGVIRLESTNLASSQNTFRLLYRTFTFVFGRVDVRIVLDLDHILRKSGHFLGYAVLSGLIFLAMRSTYRDRYRQRLRGNWGYDFTHRWQLNWAAVAILLTVITASADEIHQTYLPLRTGRWQDVAIDMSGALALQLLIYCWCRLSFWNANRGSRIPTAELSAD